MTTKTITRQQMLKVVRETKGLLLKTLLEPKS